LKNLKYPVVLEASKKAFNHRIVPAISNITPMLARIP